MAGKKKTIDTGMEIAVVPQEAMAEARKAVSSVASAILNNVIEGPRTEIVRLTKLNQSIAVVKSAEDYKILGSVVVDAKTAADTYCAPFYETVITPRRKWVDALRAIYNTSMKPLEEIEAGAKAKMAVWALAEKRREAEEKRKRDEEVARLEREAEEARRKAEEAQTPKMQAKAEVKAACDKL